MDHEELVVEVADIRGDLNEHKKVCAMEARIRAQQDRDLANTQERVKAIHTLVQALAITQSEHTTMFREHTTTLREHTTTLREHTLKLDLLELGMIRIETTVGRLETGQQTILSLLQRLTPRA